jgi:agarase
MRALRLLIFSVSVACTYSSFAGFYRVEKNSGLWRVISPDGKPVVMRGVDYVNWRGQGCWRVKPPRFRYREHNETSYVNRAEWEKETLARLRDWGFNLLGVGSDRSLEGKGLAHVRILSVGRSFMKGGDPDRWICPDMQRPGTSFPNVFHPEFAKWCDRRAAEICAPERDSRHLFGYFLDNELAWRGNGRRKDGLFKNVCSLPETHSAKKYLRNWAKRRNVNLNNVAEVDIEDFNRHLAEAYFGTAAAAIRRHDPNHLVLGARFAGAGNPPDAAWVAAGRHCDVISFNSYPHYDADKGIFRNFRKPDSQDIREAYGGRWRLAGGAPLMVTEWSFPALDAGLPCTRGAGHRMATQRERAEVSGRYVRVLAKMPYVIGYCYFMWTDQPPEGVSDSFPENSNYGLVSATGKPYVELTSELIRVQKRKVENE